MAPKEKPKGAPRPAAVPGQPKPPPKAVVTKARPSTGLVPAKEKAAVAKSKQGASGQVAQAAPKGRLSTGPKARTSGRLSNSSEIDSVAGQLAHRGSGSTLLTPTTAAGFEAPSRSTSVSSVLDNTDLQEVEELRQERDELHAENIRLQRKASQANLVATKVNDLMDRFQQRDKRQREELEAAQEEAVESAMLQAQHRKSLTSFEQHAALLEEQMANLRESGLEDSAQSLEASAASIVPDATELESELAESRRGNLVAKEAMARAKQQLVLQKGQVEEIAELHQSELAQVAEVKHELEDAIRGRRLCEEEVSSERRACLDLQSKAESSSIGASELESQKSGESGRTSMWRWAHLVFLAHSDCLDRSVGELIHATAEATARRQRAATADSNAREERIFTFASEGLDDAPEAAMTPGTSTASAETPMAASLQEALAGVQEAKAQMMKALEESEAECAYWINRARQFEERAEQADAQVRDLKEAVLRASALGRASAEQQQQQQRQQQPVESTRAAPAISEDKDANESAKITVLKMQLVAMRSKQVAAMSKNARNSPTSRAKKFTFPIESSALDLDTKVEIQSALDDAHHMVHQEEAALQAAQEEACTQVREQVETVKRLKAIHREETEEAQSKFDEEAARALKERDSMLEEKEAAMAQSAEELLSAIKDAKASTETAQSEYEEECSAWTEREAEHSVKVAELDKAVLLRVREVNGLQSELVEMADQLHGNVLEEQVHEISSRLHFYEAKTEAAELERDHLQEEMFKSMEDSMIKAQESQKVRDHLLAELAIHGADVQKHAEMVSQLTTSKELPAKELSSEKLEEQLATAEESISTEQSLMQRALASEQEAKEMYEQECELYRMTEEQMQDQIPFQSSQSLLNAEVDECAQLRSMKERAMAAEHATQQAHSAESALYRLAEDSRIAAKQDLEEYTKERRVLEDLLEEKTEEAQELASNAESISSAQRRLILELEQEQEARAEAEAKLASIKAAPSTVENRRTVHHLTEEDGESVPSVAEKQVRLELEPGPLAGADVSDKLQDSESVPSAAEKQLQLELGQERSAREEASALLQSSDNAEKRLQLELEEERSAREELLVQLHANERAQSVAEEQFQMELEQESAAEDRLRLELEHERSAREAALAQLTNSDDVTSPTEKRLRQELEEARSAREEVLVRLQANELELDQERLARAEAAVQTQGSRPAPSPAEKQLQLELEQDRSAAGAEASAQLQGNEEKRVKVELEQERLADGKVSAKPSSADQMHRLEEVRLTRTDDLSKLQGISDALSAAEKGHPVNLTQELQERDDLLSMASAEISELQSEKLRLLQDVGPCSELRLQVAGLRSSLEKRIEESARLEESVAEARPAMPSAVTAEAAALELRAQRRERLRWASEVEELQREVEASRAGNRLLSTSGAVARAVQEEFAEEWASEAAIMKTAEDAQREAVAALAEYAEELHEHEGLLRSASIQASELREEEGRCWSDGSRSGSTMALKAQVSQLEEMLDQSCLGERSLESIEAAFANDPSLAMQQAMAAACDAQQAAALSAEHFTAEASELRAELLHLVDRDARSLASNVALRVQVAALVMLVDRADVKAKLENSEARAALECAEANAQTAAHSLQDEIRHHRSEFDSLQSDHFDAVTELSLYAEELHEKDDKSHELASELLKLQNSREQTSYQDLTLRADMHGESELCAWWQAQALKQEARAENLQNVLHNMAFEEIGEVNKLKEQLSEKEGLAQLPSEEVVTASASPQLHPDVGSFQSAAGARMAQPALIAAAAGHIALLADQASLKALEAQQMMAEVASQNDEELQVQRDLCMHWEAVSMSHKNRAEQLQGIEVEQALRLTEQLHGEEARTAKINTWDHLLAARVSAEEALVAELRGEVSLLRRTLEERSEDLQDRDAEFRDLQEAEENHASQRAELHGRLLEQGSACLDAHDAASEMKMQVALMERKLNEQNFEFRRFEDITAQELVHARVELKHESSRMMEEASELRSESARCNMISAQEAAASAAHASALCDVQLTAHKVNADHNAEHECLRVEHGSEVEAAQEHREMAIRQRRELEAQQQEFAQMEMLIDEHHARAQVHHDIAEVRASEVGEFKMRLSTEEEAWWASERACAMAHNALERVAEMVERSGPGAFRSIGMSQMGSGDSTARAIDFDAIDTGSQLSRPADDEGRDAVVDIVSRARALQEHMPPTVVAADVALGQAMCTLQNAADEVMDAHFGLRNSPQKPVEAPAPAGSGSDLGRPSTLYDDDHADQVAMSSTAWLHPPTGTPSVVPDERMREAETVLIKAGGALRASADALRETRSDLERATLRHSMQAVRCWAVTPDDSMQALKTMGDPMSDHPVDEADSRSRLTAAAQGVFIAVASKKKHVVQEEHAVDLARRAQAQLRNKHFLLEAEIASERHEAASLQAKVEQLQLGLVAEEYRSAAGSTAAKEEVSALKQEQALQLQQATMRLWELSHHLEDRSSSAQGNYREAMSFPDTAKLHSVAATEVTRAEVAEASAREQYEELQSLILEDAATMHTDAEDSLMAMAEAIAAMQRSTDHQSQAEVEMEESEATLTLAQVEIEAMRHQEESETLQGEVAEMLQEIRQHAPTLDLVQQMGGGSSGAMELPVVPSGIDLEREHMRGAGVANHVAELGKSQSRRRLSEDVRELWTALSGNCEAGNLEMRQLALQAQHLAASTAMKNRSELQACEDEIAMLRKSCEHHQASGKNLQDASMAGAAEAQELAAYLAVEETAWRASHENSLARQAEHAKTNQHLEELCSSLTQRNSWLTERHDEVMKQLDAHSTSEFEMLRASLQRQRQESAALQDCLRLADVQAESTTAKLEDANLNQQAFVEECDAREAALVAELAATREEGTCELAKFHMELQERGDESTWLCAELQQRLEEEAEGREARLREELSLESVRSNAFLEELETCMSDLIDLQEHASELTELHRMRPTDALIEEEVAAKVNEELEKVRQEHNTQLDELIKVHDARALTSEEVVAEVKQELGKMRQEHHLHSTESSEELQSLLETIAGIEADKHEELQSLRETVSKVEVDEQKEMLQEASVRSAALETETQMQEALVIAAQEHSQLEEALSNRMCSQLEERDQFEEALVIAAEERSQLEEVIASRMRRGSGNHEVEIELRQARTEIHALEQIAELHAQHSLKVHRLMCEDAQQRVGGGGARPVRNSALRQWQARVADQSQVLLERSWTLLHRPDSPTGKGTSGSAITSPRALVDAQGDDATDHAGSRRTGSADHTESATG